MPKICFLSKPSGYTRVDGGGEIGANSASTGMAIDAEVLVLGNKIFKCKQVGREALEGVEKLRARKQKGFPNMSKLHTTKIAVQPAKPNEYLMFKMLRSGRDLGSDLTPYSVTEVFAQGDLPRRPSKVHLRRVDQGVAGGA